MLKKSINISIILFVCGLVLTATGFGQTRNDLVRTIEKLDRNIEMVRELVASFDNQRAQELLNNAEKLRNEAAADVQNNRFGLAAGKIKLAFSLLEQALKITLDGPVRRLRSELEELLQRAEHLVLGSQYKEAERILREAKLNGTAAEKALSARQINKAVEHYRVAITLAKRAIDMVDRPGNIDSDRIQEERTKFENLRDRARELVDKSNNDQAREIFQQAMKMAKSAEEALHNGNFELAKKFYNQSVLLLLRTMDLASKDSPATVDQTEVELFKLRELIDSAQDEIVNSGKPRANLLFERARRFAREAELATKEGHNREAIWKIDLAENMLQRAKRIAQETVRSGYTDRISQEIQDTKSEISEVRSELSTDSPKDAEVLINMAGFTITKAEQASAAGLQRVALEAVLAAQKFLTKAEGILSDRSASSITKERVQLTLQQLDETITESQDQVLQSDQDWNVQLLKSAKEIRDLASSSLEKGNYQAANEAIQVAFELIRKSVKSLPKE